jgi:hypothetical protein
MSVVIMVKKIRRLLVWKYSHVYTVMYGYELIMWSSCYTQTLPEVAGLSYFIHFSLSVLQYKDLIFLDKYGILLSAAV